MDESLHRMPTSAGARCRAYTTGARRLISRQALAKASVVSGWAKTGLSTGRAMPLRPEITASHMAEYT